jgi:hypothetical protein
MHPHPAQPPLSRPAPLPPHLTQGAQPHNQPCSYSLPLPDSTRQELHRTPDQHSLHIALQNQQAFIPTNTASCMRRNTRRLLSPAHTRCSASSAADTAASKGHSPIRCCTCCSNSPAVYESASSTLMSPSRCGSSWSCSTMHSTPRTTHICKAVVLKEDFMHAHPYISA